MGAQQDVGVAEPRELVVVDGDEAQLPQALHLAAVVHDVAQAVEGTPLLQLFLGLADGARDAKAEAGAGVNLDGQGNDAL